MFIKLILEAILWFVTLECLDKISTAGKIYNVHGNEKFGALYLHGRSESGNIFTKFLKNFFL